MRNLFDQYTQAENKLTHALVSVLNEDAKLLKQFVRWITGKAAPNNINITEQQLPGEAELSEDESERRGLPDAWIYDNESWSLLIESKVASPLKNDQLRRHYTTAQRRGYGDACVLAIDVVKPVKKLPDYVIFRAWSEVYTWLHKQTQYSEWALKAIRYMEILESKWISDGYLTEGTITVFSGIPFTEENPYSYPEAKRLIKLAMDDLRIRKELVKQLGMNPRGVGRGAITGKDGIAVWDFLRLKGSKSTENFTKYPHLSMGIHNDRIIAIITIPHGIKPEFRRNIIKLGYDGFEDLMRQVNKNLTKVLSKAKGSAPMMNILQRRYPSQRSAAIIDARLEFDLRTAFPGNKKQAVKIQAEWLMATYDALSNKRSNLQVAVGAIFPYRTCDKTTTPEILDYVVATWIACKPLLDVMLKSK